MESESSEAPGNLSFTLNSEVLDDTASHEEEMVCDPDFHHSDSYGDEFNTSQGGVSESFDDQDATSSVEEECETFQSHVGMPPDGVGNDETAYEMCFSPSYISEDLSSVFHHKDSSPVSNGEPVHLNPTQGTFTFHYREEEIPLGLNPERWCYRDPNQDVHPAIQLPEEKVPLGLSRASVAPSSFLSTFTASFFHFLWWSCHLSSPSAVFALFMMLFIFFQLITVFVTACQTDEHVLSSSDNNNYVSMFIRTLVSKLNYISIIITSVFLTVDNDPKCGSEFPLSVRVKS